MTRVISVVGQKDSGKTTLIVALAAEFTRQKHRVGTIKQARHDEAPGAPGTDIWRHFNEGMARGVLLSTPGIRILFERTDGPESDVPALIRRFYGHYDIVLVEGFPDAPLPKIEVHRKSTQRPPLYLESPGADRWVALVTDDDSLRPDITTFRFNDTAWVMSLATVAWQRAMVI